MCKGLLIVPFTLFWGLLYWVHITLSKHKENMKDEIAKPRVVEGIEFYISNSGDTGLSQSGLARLVGVSESSVRGLLDKIKNADESLPETLAGLGDTELHIEGLTSHQQAKIVKSLVAAKIVEYYAYDQGKAQAAEAFRRFAAIGFDSWVKQITGYNQSDSQGLTEKISEMMKIIMDMRGTLDLTLGYQVASQSLPGLKNIADGYDPNTKTLKGYGENELYTLTEWVYLAHPDDAEYYDRNRHVKHMLSNIVKTLYISLRLEEPEMVKRRNERGQLKNAVAAYPRRHFPILESAWGEMIRTLDRKRSKG